MSEKSKPARKSLGIWGTITMLGGLYGAVSSLPPELIEDTKTVYSLVVSTLGAVMALVGRWRASVPIKGLLKQDR